MFHLGTPAGAIALRSVLVYLVMILLISNAVQSAMVGPDSSLRGGLLAASVLLAVNAALARLRLHGGVWGRLIEGTPTVLIQDGEFVPPRLRKEGQDRSDARLI